MKKHFKEIEDKFEKMDEVTHVLRRPDMYIGSIINRTDDLYLVENEKIIKKEVTYNPGLYKMFDEILSNSVDEYKRNKKITRIDVNITKEYILVKDDGGIPIIKSEKFGNKYLPEFLFGEMRTSSNYNDSEQRLTAGVNGQGGVLTNIFSTKFSIETCDTLNLYKQEFTNNLSNISTPVIKAVKNKPGYTQITFYPDVEKFKLTEIDETHIEIFHKKVLDFSAIYSEVDFYFNGQKIVIKDFKTYCKLYLEESVETIYEENENWKVGLSASQNGFQCVSFSNGICTINQGTHVEYIFDKIVEIVKTYLNKKFKLDLKNYEIRSQLFLFVSANIVNNKYTSQTKEKLSTEVKDFGSSFDFSKKTLKQILESEIVKQIVDWKKQKDVVAEKVELRKLSKQLDRKRIENLYDCTSKNIEDRKLLIFEGFSAIVGSIKLRDSKTQGLYSLRGKILNTNEKTSKSKILENKELSGLIRALGLDLSSSSISELRYSSVLIVCDSDSDGENITSLIINFLFRFWPDLFKDSKILKVLTPIMIVENKKERFEIYTEQEYENFIKTHNISNYTCSFKKGIGALDDRDMKDMLEKPRLMKIEFDEKSKETIDIWFSKDDKMLAKRKEIIIQRNLEHD